MSLFWAVVLTSCIIWVSLGLFIHFGIRHLEKKQSEALKNLPSQQ